MKNEEKKDYVLDGAKKVMEELESSLSKEDIEKLDNEESDENDLKDEAEEEDLGDEEELDHLEEDIKAIEEEKKEFLDKGEIEDDDEEIEDGLLSLEKGSLSKRDPGEKFKTEIKETNSDDFVQEKNVIGKSALEELDEEKEKESLRRIEAVLFVSGRFLNLQELISYTDINPIILRELIENLIEKYENDETSSLQIIQKNNLYKMDVKLEYQDVINRLATGRSEFTKAEKETLAIIAYKQPIKQSVVIKIRGNKAYDHIKKYVELGLIKRKKVGHTNELTLSDEFYDYFGMTSGEGEVKEIPRIESGDEE